MFLNEASFNKLHQEMGESCDYKAMRQEVADKFFDGNHEFSGFDAIEIGFDQGGGIADFGVGGDYSGGGDMGSGGDGS